MKSGYKLDIELTLVEDMLGTIPKEEKVFKAYLKHRAGGKEQKDEFKSPLNDAEVSEREAKGWTGFMEEDNKPFIMNYMIKGFLKNSGNIQKDKSIAIKNLKSKVNDFVYIYPRRIFFDGNKKEHPLERPLRAMTMQGPRVSLVRSDVMEAGAKLSFEIHVPYACEIKQEHIEKMLDHGQYMGLGQFRNGAYGSFTYKVVSSDKI